MLQNLDSRPVIITGDLNCLYGRDELKQELIDAVNESGRATAADVWVELQQGGFYPTEPATETASGEETLDKIIYINPVMGTQREPVAFSTDREGYLHDGKPLGDHWPVAATFQISASGKTTGIKGVDAQQEGSHAVYNLNGQRVDKPQGGLYIEQREGKTEKRIVK